MKAQLDALPPPQPMPLVLASNDMGVEFVFEKRGPALDKFAEYLDEELAKNEHREESGITIVGTSLRAFLIPSDLKFDGKEIIRRALKKKCPLRILLTDPEVSEQRACQEGADAGAIARQIRESIRELGHAGVPKQAVRYYRGGPTVFGIATSSNMLLNPYPLAVESHRCFALIVQRTQYSNDIYRQYRKDHFDKTWDHGVAIPDNDWHGAG